MTRYCVISHTHWDREWYMSLEEMKLRLCDLMDHCLAILENQTEYIFHLDAQTVVLEDYLEIRPENRTRLERLVREQRLMVGPWYLQNDFYLSSGEATIRNLLEGKRIAWQFGHCDSVGYAPDQFGNIAQLPQILRGFGITNFIFGRGILAEQPDGRKTPAEFVWEGSDGSRVLAVHLRYWYNNAQHIPHDPERGAALLWSNKQRFQGAAQTPYFLLMNGVDHLEPQPDVLENLAGAAKLLPEDETVAQGRLSDYMESLEAYFQAHGAPVFLHQGELRQGPDDFILNGTLSSRYYLKEANVKAQTMLENVLEPLYSMLELSGMKGAYSVDHFRYLWKQLLRNLPHDSICGCSVDSVHKHMEDNYARLNTTAQDMRSRGMQLAAAHLDLPGRTEDNYLITVANTTQQVFDSVVEVDVDIPVAEDCGGLRILNADGIPVDYRILSARETVHDCFSPLNLPGKIPVIRYCVSLKTDAVEPFAFKGFVVEPAERAEQSGESIFSVGILENEHLKVSVSQDGRVTLIDKVRNVQIEDLLDLEDSADCGDSYVYFPAQGEAPIYASNFQTNVSVERQDSLVQQITIRRNMELPECFDFISRRRSDHFVTVPTEITLRLRAGSPRLEIDTAIDNKARDHRLRMIVRTGIQTDISVADTPFDILRRKSGEISSGSWSNTQPNTSFAALEGGDHSIAVLTMGAHEYEHIPEEGTLAFTLVRSTGVILRNHATFQQSGGDQWICPENQCLRRMTGQFALQPYSGKAESANIPAQAIQFRSGVSVFYISGDERRFMRGRAVVQESGVDGFYYLEDPYMGIKIPDNQSLLKMNDRITVSALKKTEDGRGILLRVVNYGQVEEQIWFPDGRRAFLVNLDETPIEDRKPAALVNVKSKKITSMVFADSVQ